MVNQKQMDEAAKHANALYTDALGRLQLVNEMIANGKAKEAAEHAKMLSFSVPEYDARVLVRILADAILDPQKLKRKRGDKFVNHMTLEKIASELHTAKKVGDAVATSKARSRPGRKKHVDPAFKKVAKEKGSAVSAGTAKRRYYKYK